MKGKLIIIAILFFIVSLFDIALGYESTEKEEELARTGIYNEAWGTTAEENISRRADINEAYSTENEEEFWRSGLTDDGYSTEAAERAARNSVY